MDKFYFTFGQGHHDENHKSLGDYYTYVEANSEREARIEMCALRADKWCMVYLVPDLMHRQGLELIPFHQLTAQPGPTR